MIALKVIDHAMRDCRVFPHKSNKGSRKFQPGIEVPPEELEEERLCLLDWLENDGDKGFRYWCAEAQLTWAEHDELKEYMQEKLTAYA